MLDDEDDPDPDLLADAPAPGDRDALDDLDDRGDPNDPHDPVSGGAGGAAGAGPLQQAVLRAGVRRRRPARRHWRESHRPSEVAVRCAQILEERKLEGIEIFDVASSLQIADYFVIAHGRNPRQIQGAAEQVSKALRESGIARSGMEGYREGRWILLDFDDVVVHLFLPDSRKFYDLELLWGDCPRLGWVPSPRPVARPQDDEENVDRDEPEEPRDDPGGRELGSSGALHESRTSRD